MGGSSKGGGGHTPHEAPDSLRSAQKLRAIGLISLGPIKGPANKWKDTYFDNTPIQNANGVDDNDAASFNFKNTEIQYNLGYQDQRPLEGFEASEREVSVGAEVKQQHPITRSVIDPDVTRLRLTIGVNALISQNDQGDTNGTSVDFQILVNNTPRGTYQIEGKSSSRFYRSYIIDDLPPRPFTVTVKRITEDSKSQRLQNGTHWVSYTEIIDTKLSYPNMAIVGIKTDSRYNPNFPNINFLLYGRIIKIPTTYDPEARTYAPGLWRGDFKMGWTNNPAWIFYDLITDKLAGLGERIGDFGIDKFMLYEIAKYCDELVDDGYGGKEPRMVSNLWITEQRDAYNVISDMASVFRAIAVWDGTQFTAIQDRPTDPACLYTQSNVVDGKFSRQYTAGKAIFTAVEVEYADERNLYQKSIEYVADDGMIARYGYNVKKMTAYGCTSRGQAHRYGKWVLETSRLEQCTITFTVGRQGLMHLPGDIIEIADNDYAGQVIGGRVIAVNGRQVTLDRAVEITENSHLSYLNAGYQLTKIKIISAQGAVVTLDTAPDGLKEYDDWVLKTSTVSTQLYRALGISENDDGSYTITALQHEPQKEAIVDNGARFEPKATSILSVPQVSNIGVTVNPDGSVSFAGDVTGGNGVIKYDFRIYKDGALYDIRLGQTSPNLNLDGLENGEYSVLIQVKNEKGQVLSERTQTFVIDKPPVPTGVGVTGGLGNITIEWDWINDATATEIFVSETDDIKTATRLTRVTAKMYSHEVGAKQVRYYWLRHTRGVNVGPFSQQSGLRGESAVDIDAELEVLNKKLSQNIVNEVIDTALPARNLDLIKTVNGLNTGEYQGHKQVYNTADGKLYTWNGSRYLENGIDINGVQIKTTQLVGTLQADQIGANTIGAGALQAGAVRAEHMAAGQITADKLAIGLGGNLFYNPIFANPTDGVPDGWTLFENNLPLDKKGERYCFQDPDYGMGRGGYLKNENILRWHNKITNDARTRTGIYQNVPINANHWYMVSAYMGNHSSSKVEMYIDARGANGEWLLNKIEQVSRQYGFRGIGNAKRAFIKFKAPPNAVSVDVFFFLYDGDGSNPNGAWMFLARPMLEECTEYTTQPSPWQNAGVTAIHGGSIVTRTITTEQLAANSVTANEIATGAVAAKHVAAGSIGATHIATRSLTADKLNVSQLSAVSSNMGDINGGSLNINNRFKVSRSGQVEMRASAGNVGMIITNEAISVYDERGRLRVKMGRL